MLKTIGNQFKRPSGFLGRIISLLMKKGNAFAYQKIFKKLELKDNDSLLEIGYGHGLGAQWILSKYDCSYEGVDFSKLMSKEATKRNKKYIDQGKAKFHFGDFLDFELNRSKLDKVFCINVIYFWSDLIKPFTKICNGLNENGVFCFYMAKKEELQKLKFTSDDIFNKYTIEDVVDKLKTVGFSEVDYNYDNGYFVKCEK